MEGPLFILCPPRSYSSLVCAMIGQHPECYGLPELNLFVADDLAGAWRWMERIMPHGRDGLLRTLAQLEEGQQTEDAIERARAWVERNGSWSPRQVFQHIQGMVGDRRLVEKSPSTVYNMKSLQRMRAAFPDADYLHLIRHPHSTCRSLLSLAERSAAWNGRLSTSELDPERAWLTGHKNIVEFTHTVPLGQCMRIKGEALLSHLTLYLPQIAEWLGIRADADAIEQMMHPERSPYAHPGPDNAAHGNDPDFIDNPILDLPRLAGICEPTLADGVGLDCGKPPLPATRKYTHQLGYL